VFYFYFQNWTFENKNKKIRPLGRPYPCFIFIFKTGLLKIKIKKSVQPYLTVFYFYFQNRLVETRTLQYVKSIANQIHHHSCHTVVCFVWPGYSRGRGRCVATAVSSCACCCYSVKKASEKGRATT
jgi:hypothetical protein